ncbi:MAG: ASPIC/UnbV domain-containing protein, partial [Calditrichaeota bacterium]|nr:ASPIC/UnbV domain-containing protein [Calditrichota bacterium]
GEEDLLLINKNGLRFENISHNLGKDFQEKFVGRGSAVGDYDNDGDLDILVLNLNNRPRLLRNEGGNNRNWLMIQLVGSKSNRDAIGARVRLKTGDKVQTRWRVSSSGYLSQSDYRIHFGLDKEEIAEKIEILWPSGKITNMSDIKVNQFIKVYEAE